VFVSKMAHKDALLNIKEIKIHILRVWYNTKKRTSQSLL